MRTSKTLKDMVVIGATNSRALTKGCVCCDEVKPAKACHVRVDEGNTRRYICDKCVSKLQKGVIDSEFKIHDDNTYASSTINHQMVVRFKGENKIAYAVAFAYKFKALAENVNRGFRGAEVVLDNREANYQSGHVMTTLKGLDVDIYCNGVKVETLEEQHEVVKVWG